MLDSASNPWQWPQTTQTKENSLPSHHPITELSSEDDDDQTVSNGHQRVLAWKQLGVFTPFNMSSSTMIDAGEDMLESHAQRLQTEVVSTRAIVLDLESRLDLAEQSNRHIVEELKRLLAEAEATLVDHPASQDHGPSQSSTRLDYHHDEDPNVVYNRICIALQSLITEAQAALERNASSSANLAGEVLASQLPNDHSYLLHPRGHPPKSPPSSHFEQRPMCFDCNRHRLVVDARPCSCDSVAQDGTSAWSDSTTSVSALLLWQTKQEEQHFRFRKSSAKLSLELELESLGKDPWTDAEEDAHDLWRHHSVPARRLPVQKSSLRKGILRNSSRSSTDGEESSSSTSVERYKKNLRVQFLEPQVEGRDTRAWRDMTTPRHRHQPQMQPQLSHRGVGGNSSQGVALQLYGLWKQTWLRTRIMHVLTGSAEFIIVIFLVIKAGQASLSWLGLDPWAIGTQWVTFVYGHRSEAGSAAKEIYEKVRKDGLQWRKIRPSKPEVLVEELVAGTSNILFSPTALVYNPVKKVLTHVATGAALAYFSGQARRISRSL